MHRKAWNRSLDAFIVDLNNGTDKLEPLASYDDDFIPLQKAVHSY